MRLLILNILVAIRRTEILLYLHRRGLGALLYLLPYQHKLHAGIISEAVGQSGPRIPIALALPNPLQRFLVHRALLPRLQ
jgi:hypothetical protein